jgi:hypothetical protein
MPSPALRHQLGFVDDDEITAAKALRISPDALDIGEHNRRVPIAPA